MNRGIGTPGLTNTEVLGYSEELGEVRGGLNDGTVMNEAMIRQQNGSKGNSIS